MQKLTAVITLDGGSDGDLENVPVLTRQLIPDAWSASGLRRPRSGVDRYRRRSSPIASDDYTSLLRRAPCRGVVSGRRGPCGTSARRHGAGQVLDERGPTRWSTSSPPRTMTSICARCLPAMVGCLPSATPCTSTITTSPSPISRRGHRPMSYPSTNPSCRRTSSRPSPA